MIDFTLKVYKKLLNILKGNNYAFHSFEDFIQNPHHKTIILRHDIDKKSKNALKFAEIEHTLDINASYYFRISPKSFNAEIIENISSLGHEIGYHYENLTRIYARMKNEKMKINTNFQELLFERAIESFERNLNRLRKIYPVKTICMHGSPLSKWDNRDLWKKYNYRDFGIIGDPYFDLDFNEILYLSDTGRCWNGSDVSVRDKVKSKYNYNFRSTFDIINNIDILPDKIMFNIHPQRWNDNLLPWLSEYVLQKVKNIVKRYFFVGRGNK